MKEDLTKIYGWVEDDPVELVRDATGDPATTALTDEEARGACEGIRAVRAQFVVDNAFATLIQHAERLERRDIETQAEIDELDKEYLTRRASLVERLETAGKQLTIIYAATSTLKADAGHRTSTEPGQDNLGPKAQKIIELIEHKGSAPDDEVIDLMDEFGPFTLEFSPNPEANDYGLEAWLDAYKEATNSPYGNSRGGLIRSLERAVKRFSGQRNQRFGHGNGFDFIRNLDEGEDPIVDIIRGDLAIGVRRVITTLEVLKPKEFAQKALSKSHAETLKNAGGKTLLALRLIAELQKTQIP